MEKQGNDSPFSFKEKDMLSSALAIVGLLVAIAITTIIRRLIEKRER